jgi:uncharacterized protein YbjT (DUF2867 family)
MILITGAAGQVGNHLLNLFIRANHPVRILVRKPEAFRTLGDSVEIVTGHLGDEHSRAAAMVGVDTLFLLSGIQPTLIDIQCAAIDAAQRAGVKHVVKLSGLGASAESPSRLLRFHGVIENYLINSGMQYTNLQPNSFMQNFSHNVKKSGCRIELATPLGGVAHSYIDARDVADVAFIILTSGSQYNNQSYALSGPEKLSDADIVRQLSNAADLPVDLIDIPHAKEYLLKTGLPLWWADYLIELRHETEGLVFSTVNDIFTAITKKTPRTFKIFCEDYSAILFRDRVRKIKT